MSCFSNKRAGSTDGAGSFGGFLKRPSAPGSFFGITAAHCVPGGLIGMPICSPSTLEVTARLQHLVGYTRFGPLGERYHVNPTKDTEVDGLLHNHQINNCSSGVRFLNPNNNFQLHTGVVSGANVGMMVKAHFGSHSDLLHNYDQILQRCRLPSFSASVSWLTRMDFAIFTCNPDRYCLSG